jgi:glutathione synthase
VKAPKIVEINTIAAGMGPLCTAAGDMHKHIMERHLEDTYGYDSKSVAVNESIPNGTRAFHVAVTAYKKHVLKPVDQKKQVYVMFLVQEKEKNYPDQLQMELDLWDTYKIAVIRKTLQQLSAGASKVTSEGYLLVDNCHVAVVYYRSCYTPRDFKSEKDWATFTSVETSRAVKCPSVAFHLSGCKKVQHALNQPNTLTDLKIPESNLPTALVDSHEFEPDCGPEQAVVTQAAIEDAIKHPELWVLKPQREGGGNNLWNDEMVAYLEENQNNWTKLQPFILMKRILVTPHIAALCKAGYVNVVPAIPEIGMFSYQLVHTEQYPELAEQENWSATGGYLVRTKTHTTTEGGVSSGHAFIDSLQIV